MVGWHSVFLTCSCWKRKICPSVFISPLFLLFVEKNTFGETRQLEVPFNADYDVNLYLTDYLTPEFTSGCVDIPHVYQGANSNTEHKWYAMLLLIMLYF